MSYKSLVTPNLNAQAQAGWCLTEDQQVFQTPVANPDAWTAYLNTTTKHETRDLPDVPVPLFFSWINRHIGNRNYGKNQGHTVSWIPGHGFLSSPGAGFGQQWFPSIVAVENYFRCTFVGWTEDLNGKKLVEYIPDAVPSTSAPIVNTGQGGDFKLVVGVLGYVNAADAASRQNSNSNVPAGDYKIFNEADGVVNITSDPTQPGWWINPSDNSAPAPDVVAPVVPGFNVGDTVAPNTAVSYTGEHLTQWDSSYTITEIVGDRAVLSARGTIWAAMNVSNIHKV
jgi:hypothetical protein